MEIRKVLALRGPNVWANFPVLEVWVDLGELKDSPSNSMPGFNERLMGWFPTMIEHRCSVGERGGFFQRLRTGTYLAHILEHVTLELQTLAGTPVGYGRARETLGEGYYKVSIEYKEEELCREAVKSAHQLLLAAIHDKPFDVPAEIRKLRDLLHNVSLGPSTRSIVRAAEARGIPTRRLNSGSLVMLGYGAKQRRILAAETDRTGAIAQDIAQDKEITRGLLRAIGVPTPEGRPVANAEDAWTAACELETAVVVKPQFGNQGRGVATNLTTREQILAAYEAATREGASILVETFAPGSDYRLLVVGEKVIAAARREPAQVIGDGRHTVVELIEQVNSDSRRGDDHATALTKIRLDPIALGVLAEQGLTPVAVPSAGTKVIIRRNANLSTGGTAMDVTECVHPEVAARAIEAARMVGLDIAGVDVVALDIGRPLEEQGGVIVEVNAAPGLRMHLEPSSGISRPVGEAIVSTLFAEGQNGRIPLVAVTGTNGKTTTARFISHILQTTGQKVGMTCTDGIFIDGRRINTGDCSGPQSARAVLLNPQVQAAVLECARGGILREGLGFDHCDVAVVTNIGEGDHLGVSGIDTVEQLAAVKRATIDVVQKQGYGVLKADDPLVAGMAVKCPGKVIFFCRDAQHPVMVEHRAKGGKAVFVHEGHITAAEGDRQFHITPLSRVPLTHQGTIGFQVENALATAAAVWALGVPVETIRVGLETFTNDLEKVPGRFNVMEIGGAKVIIDYGHNASALVALIEAIETFPHQRRSIVYSAAGDRRDSDMVRQGELLGEAFDRVIVYEDHYKRGRRDGEIIGLFREGLAKGRRVSDVQDVQGAVKAVETALRGVRPGELMVLQADVIDETLDFVRRYVKVKTPDRELDLSEALNMVSEAAVAFASQAMD
jgi:cyanophycin synthetase